MGDGDETGTATAFYKELPDDSAARLERIKVCRREVRQAQRVVDRLQTELKTARGALDVAGLRLLEEIGDDQLPLQFPGPESPDAWRDEAITVLELPDGLAGKLVREGLCTLGELATYRKTKMLADIDGIGTGAIQKIDDAMLAYWAAHPQAAQETAEEETQ